MTLLDDCLEAVSFTGVSSFRYLPYLVGILVGKPDLFPGVDVRAAQRLELKAVNGKPVPIQVDGEVVGFLPATVSVVLDALTLLLPRAYIERAGERRWKI